jgi:hypothetical protein
MSFGGVARSINQSINQSISLARELCMEEQRKKPRFNVLWRAVIKLGEGNIVPVEITNISKNGVLMQSPGPVEINQEYRLMMDVPNINPAAQESYQVHCTMLVLNSQLNDGLYHVNLKFTELSDLHRCLFEAWLSLVSR